jgi:hypothetical protein
MVLSAENINLSNFQTWTLKLESSWAILNSFTWAFWSFPSVFKHFLIMKTARNVYTFLFTLSYRKPSHKMTSLLNQFTQWDVPLSVPHVFLRRLGRFKLFWSFWPFKVTRKVKKTLRHSKNANSKNQIVNGLKLYPIS